MDVIAETILFQVKQTTQPVQILQTRLVPAVSFPAFAESIIPFLPTRYSMDILCLHSYFHLILANKIVNNLIFSLLSLFLLFLFLNVVNKSF